MKFKELFNKLIGWIILLLPPVAATVVPQIAEQGGWAVMASTLGGVMSLSIILTEPIKLKFNLGTWAQRIVSWAFSVIIIYLSSVAGWAFVGYEWYMYLLSGVGVGLAANGTFTMSQVEAALTVLFSAIKPKE